MSGSPEIACRKLLDGEKFRLDLELLGGEDGLHNPIRLPRIQKPGLALAGYSDQIQPFRVQILGETEIEFLRSLPEEIRDVPIKRIFNLGVACYVVTKGLEIPSTFIEQANLTSTPLFRSRLRTSDLIERVERFLEESLAPTTHLHGVLMDVMGVGILLRGPSGVGKSECALDLVMRGHRLVADDVVAIKKLPPFRLHGMGAGIIRYHMEIRGLGIINIQELFGTMAVRPEKGIDLVVDLEPWTEGREYDRLGLDEERYTILDVDVPYLRIPVAPGRNIASVVEVAARNFLLKIMGMNSAIALNLKLEEKLKGG